MIGFAGRVKWAQLQQGQDPFALPKQLQPPTKANGKLRRVPAPHTLQPLTPEVFDAMFPGKQFDGPRKRRVKHG